MPDEHDAAQAAEAAKAAEAVETAREHKKSDYCGVFSSGSGAKVLRDLMLEFHFVAGTHIPGDPYETAFREGERNVILYILSKMERLGEPQHLLKEIEDARSDYAGY